MVELMGRRDGKFQVCSQLSFSKALVLSLWDGHSQEEQFAEFLKLFFLWVVAFKVTVVRVMMSGWVITIMCLLSLSWNSRFWNYTCQSGIFRFWRFNFL